MEESDVHAHTHTQRDTDRRIKRVLAEIERFRKAGDSKWFDWMPINTTSPGVMLCVGLGGRPTVCEDESA